MLALLQLLIHGHVHKWKHVETVPYKSTFLDGEKTGRRVYVVCEVCGKPKKFDLI